jgi:hypothetical protein
MLDQELTAVSEKAVSGVSGAFAVTATATALAVGFALVSALPASQFAWLSPVRQPETGQRDASEANAKFLQRSSARS